MRKGSLRERSGLDVATASAPVAAEAGDQEASSARARIPEVVPVGWLDRLLAASLDLPLLAGERAVVEACVDAVAAIAHEYAVGVCFVPEAAAGAREQIVIQRLPDGYAEAPAGVDPTRIFPAFAHEHAVAIPGAGAGSTLHAASDDDRLLRDDSAVVHLVERAATMLGKALGHARDIGALGRGRAEARALEQRMIQADKLATFGQIAAGVVHELNNPLTSIVAYSEYLIRKTMSRGGVPDEDELERLRRISQSATRMLHFTRDLVSYARPSTGAAGPVVLHAVIDQAVAFCEHVLSEAGVSIERRYGPEVLTVRGVGEQLTQVFVNLLTNASQAAPNRDGCVVVSTSLSARDGVRRVLVCVEDNGSGIAPEHLPRVFVPFFTTKADRQGTGLGLSIVKSILETHDGGIRVESDLGRGTRFVIELPTWSRG